MSYTLDPNVSILRRARLAGRKSPALPPPNDAARRFVDSSKRIVNPFNFVFLKTMSSENENGCWVWQGSCCTDGYGQVLFFGERWGAHQASWYMTNGDIPEGKCVLHHCDNPPCINPSHLFLGTKKDNSIDCAIKGRGGGQIVGPTQALEIRRLVENGSTQQAIADVLGMSQSGISRIVSKERFAYV